MKGRRSSCRGLAQNASTAEEEVDQPSLQVEHIRTHWFNLVNEKADFSLQY